MGERIPASIRFGGKLPRAAAEELLELVQNEGLGPDWEFSDETTLEDLGKELGDNEVNYGNLDELTDFARTHGLAFVHWWDHGSDWLSGFCKRDAEGREEQMLGTPDNPLFETQFIKKVGLEAILELVEWAAADLPPFEVTE